MDSMALEKSDFGLSQIGQIAVTVKDLDRAIGFYRDVLGMKFLFQAPPALAFFSAGDVRLMLNVPENEEFDHPASIIYYRVRDVKEAHQVLSERGVRFVGAPHVVHRTDTYELWMADFRDSEDNLLVLMCEVARA
jgi:methylmalonyl-CoA/ethylmalonyl-CoA epimerase